jgi:hypothetical protein
MCRIDAQCARTQLKSKLLHGWPAAMRSSEIRYALTPVRQCGWCVRIISHSCAQRATSDFVRHVVVDARARLRLFVVLLPVWRDDDDDAHNVDADVAGVSVTAELQITCRVVQHDCHPVRVLARWSVCVCVCV